MLCCKALASLQQGFLMMDQHPSSLPAFGHDAPGPQWTYTTFGPVELEGLESMDTARAVSPLSRRHDGTGNLTRRTGGTARGQLKVKVTCGESPPSQQEHPTQRSLRS